MEKIRNYESNTDLVKSYKASEEERERKTENSFENSYGNQ